MYGGLVLPGSPYTDSTLRPPTSARRFFRFFGFIGSFQHVSDLLGKDGVNSVAGWLDLAKYTCFALYFLLEDLTIVRGYLQLGKTRVVPEDGANSDSFTP